jgi:DNA repair exonuclease SbcCD ATPase subunit
MSTVEQMRNVAQNLIVSYDARVDAIGTLIDDTYQILEDFKNKRVKLSAELKETLAKRESLRKKDFDRMTNGVLLNQEEKEKEVKESLKNFIKEQKKQAGELKDAVIKGEAERTKKAQVEIEKGIAEIKELLKDFCEQQEELTDRLRKLLTKGNDLKIRDFKDMIQNLQTLTKAKEVKKMGLSDVVTDIKNLTQDMAASHADRVASIEALSNETKEIINTFQNEQAERKTEVNTMLESFTDGLQKEVHQFTKGVHQFMKGLHSENAQNRVEVNDLLASFQEHMKDVRKENAQRGREVHKLLEGIQKEMEGFRKENKLRHNEVGRVVEAVKEMWSTVARAKGGAKKVRACSWAQTKKTKPARRAKGKSKKVQSL